MKIGDLTYAAVLHKDMQIPVSLFGQDMRISLSQIEGDVSGAVSGDISALWQESESIRRYCEISYSALDASISNINNEMTVIQNKQQTLTETEVEGMVNNILQ